MDGGGDVGGVHLPYNRVFRQHGEERHALAVARLFLRNRGHDVDMIHLSHRELRFGVEESDGVDAVALEFDTDGIFLGIGEDVEDVAAPCELPGLIDEVLGQVFQFVEFVEEIIGEDFLAALHGEGFLVDIVLGDNGFRHAFGIRDKDKRLRAGHRQFVKDFGAEFHVGGVGLAPAAVALVRRRQVEHPLVLQGATAVVEQHLHIAVEEGGLLAVAEDEQLEIGDLFGHGGRDEGKCGALHAIYGNNRTEGIRVQRLRKCLGFRLIIFIFKIV